ncbi:MAG: hypothetical protein DI498_03420 [Paracoccus denitrificans]|nr:MAG: hypothetical protein DI498_03420 [Paracoccus denitrificans]PZO85577.1 MAG: hypothetical protein DI633_03420 [Paracoccus denitrificans]
MSLAIDNAQTAQRNNNDSSADLTRAAKLTDEAVKGNDKAKDEKAAQSGPTDNLKEVPEIETSLPNVKVSGTDNGQGGEKTVTEQATAEMFDAIKKDIDDKKLSEDSPEAKLMRAFQAKSAVDDGYDLHGYVELKESGGSTYRESDIDPTKLNSSDVKELVDSDKLDKQIIDLMGDEAITKRYQQSLTDTVDKLPKDTVNDLKEKVESALFLDGDTKEPNSNFEKNIIALYDKGDDASREKAGKLIDSHFETLKILDPEAHATRRQQLNTVLMTHEIDSKMADPSLVSDSEKAASVQDTISAIKSGVNGALNAGKFGTMTDDQIRSLKTDLEVFQEKIKGLDKSDVANIFDALTQSGNETTQAGLVDKIDKHVGDLKAKNAEGYNSFKKVAAGMQSSGLLGSAAGMMSLMSGIAGMTRGDMTSTEKMAVARDFIGAASQTKDFATFGLTITNHLTNTFGSTGDQKPSEMKAWSQASQWLGLDGDNFPDIWKPSPDVSSGGVTPDNASDASFHTAATHFSADQVATASDNLELHALDANGNTVQDGGNMPSQSVLEEMGKGTGGSGLDKDTAVKAGKAFSRFVLGSGLDVVGGVMDLVTGAQKLKDADTELEKAGAGIGITNGALTTAFGLNSAISMVAPKSASLSGALSQISGIANASRVLGVVTRFAGPALGVIGGVLGVVGGIISGLIIHNKMQKVTDEQGQFFKDLARDGVTKDDWGDKLEYARYASYMYGGRDSPDDKSLFEFQKDEWDHFKDADAKDGSSLNRLAPYLHKDSDFSKQNLFEKFMNGQTTSQIGRYETKTDDARPWSDTHMDAGAPSEGTTTAYFEQKVAAEFNSTWYDERSDELSEVLRNWDSWNGSDKIVSAKDLTDVMNDTSRSDQERAAAKFLLEDVKFRDAVDGVGSGGKPDGKISNSDLNSWLSAIGKGGINEAQSQAATQALDESANGDEGFYGANRENIDRVAEHWDDWNGKDKIVSEKDLKKFAGDTSRGDEERAAAQFLLDERAFFNALDGMDDSGKLDGKISTDDLRKWFTNANVNLSV